VNRLAHITLGLAAIAIALSCGARSSPPTTVMPTARPNIVLILTDDLDLEPVAYMPHLRSELTSQGVSFTNALVTNSMSVPSRVSLLTGRYAHNHGVLTDRPPTGSFRRLFRDGGEAKTIATDLQAEGYRTAFVGRYLDFYPRAQDRQYIPPGWSHWSGLFFPEDYYNFSLNHNGQILEFGASIEDYQTGVLSSLAMEFLASTTPDEPFFLELAFLAPHRPFLPAARHSSIYPTLEPKRSASFDEQDVSRKPEWIRSLPRLTEEDATTLADDFRKRVRMLQAVDESVAAIVGRLRERNQLQNTYVVFTSDGGFQQGAHRIIGDQGDAYEASVRVPLIVRGPGVPANRRVDRFALNIDVAPTLAELAGVALPGLADGRSLLPLLGEELPEEEEWRSDFLIEHWVKKRGGIPEYGALRTARHLFVQYETGERELYDVSADPHQLDNLIDGAEVELVTSLQTRLAALRECAGDVCRESPPQPAPDPEELAPPTELSPEGSDESAEGHDPY
jgi:arylsulfatase A-like enzyme